MGFFISREMKKEPIVNLSLALSHGLTEEEYYRIIEILGRVPNYTELGIFSVMWSEHCSYKNSIALIKTLPRSGEKLLVQAGEENAGLVDIGNGLAVAFKIESHNHPSAIEPYQGAATGVGGILRDIFTMGARPIALLNSLRFGNPSNPRVRYLIEGVVKGISDYGNCFGVPTVGGEVYFEDCYTENPIVNAMAVGIVDVKHIARAIANGNGNVVMIVGSSTGRDGIHGATFASMELDENSEERRPNVQVGDPFTEKLLLEATLEAIATGYVVGVQDMGAAGITCSTSEMSARGKSGMSINLDNVHVREKDMTAYELMLSESQERMLFVVKKGHEEDILEILKKWDLKASIIGLVHDDNKLVVYKNGELFANIPADSLVLGGGAPVYYRDSKKPRYIEDLGNIDINNIPEPTDIGDIIKILLKTPNLSSKRWISTQYDSMVRTNTIQKNIIDASIVRIKNTRKALALTTDGNSRYVYLNPKRGSEIAVAEAARNVVVCGARPVAITNCLNYGNPYDPEIYWQFKESIEGIRDACRILETPVTGGNVSFYNESKNYTVYPTPVIGMLGIIDDINFILSTDFKEPNDYIILIGNLIGDINGSEYLKTIHKIIAADAPYLDLDYEKRLYETILTLNKLKLLNSAHDVSEGGIAIALAEICILSNLGANIKINKFKRLDYLLFGEEQSRIIVSINSDKLRSFKNICEKFNIEYYILGRVINEPILKINEKIILRIDEIKEIYTNSLEKIMNEKN